MAGYTYGNSIIDSRSFAGVRPSAHRGSLQRRRIAGNQTPHASYVTPTPTSAAAAAAAAAATCNKAPLKNDTLASKQ
jgi:hypothetical protein